MKVKLVGLLCLFLGSCYFANSQSNFLKNSKITGNFQLDGQFYLPDSVIGADTVKDYVRANAFANINYSNGGFSAGFRYEFYQFPLIDFERIGYVGNGIPYFYAGYNHEYFEVVAGSFYEQFGNGLIYRSYENRYLGIDNSTVGVKVKGKPYKGIILTGFWGTQRNLFVREGQIRGVDGDFMFSEIFSKLQQKDIIFGIGGSFVSKYEKDDDPDYQLPENVAAAAARLKFGIKGFQMDAEYAFKINDPIGLNNYIYKNGNAFLLNMSYSMKGFGVSLTAIRNDNMDFRAKRTATLNNNLINYIPAITREHTYALPAMYPYSSQTNEQIGFQGQITWNIKKGSKVGGKYGTELFFNYSRMHGLKKTLTQDAVDNGNNIAHTDGYTSEILGFGDLFYQDLNFGINRKFNSHWKLGLEYVYLIYNQEIIEGHSGEPNVHSHTIIADLTYKINSKHALRLELQHLYAKEGKGSWAYGQLEYTIAPHWFISILDRWNYGNPEKEKRVHYFMFSGSFAYKTTKVTLSFGKQYEGILCVGGVCRTVPASYGVGLQIVTAF
ncbi:MAG: DUF6029 family protein [Bacteroidales bacterium]|jgi:hypothetical protein|nr:DUF6029 family protein [Bacteroidales bacterium]